MKKYLFRIKFDNDSCPSYMRLNDEYAVVGEDLEVCFVKIAQTDESLHTDLARYLIGLTREDYNSEILL